MNNKYDNIFYKDIKYSLSIILKYIRPETRILEFGPGNGDLTKYLKEEYSCNMYTVEIDDKLYNISKQYTVDSICCDADRLDWYAKFKNIEFDYIIFADVLEHLRNPQKVLFNAVRLLKETGNILFSIPNIAHNDIILNLINNKFTYTEEGLLDKTHIHFFTYQSIIEMLQKAGLNNIEIDKVIKQTGFTEQNISLDLIPDYILDAIKDKDYGDVYQFVGKAGISVNSDIKRIEGRQIIESYHAVLLFADESIINAEILYNEYTKQLTSEIIIHKQESVEFDIVLFPGMVSIKIDDIQFNAGEIIISSVNAGKVNGRDIFFNEAKYHIRLNVIKNVDHLNIMLKWSKKNISYDEMKSISWVTKEFYDNKIIVMNDIMHSVLKEKDAEIIARDEEIIRLNAGLREKDAEIIARDEEIIRLNAGLREKDAEIIARDEQVKQYMSKVEENKSLYIDKVKELELDNLKLSNEIAGIKESFFYKFIK